MTFLVLYVGRDGARRFIKEQHIFFEKKKQKTFIHSD